MSTTVIPNLPVYKIAYRLIGPNGEDIPITKEVFTAFRVFLPDSTGSLTVEFKSGGIAGVSTSIKSVLK